MTRVNNDKWTTIKVTHGISYVRLSAYWGRKYAEELWNKHEKHELDIDPASHLLWTISNSRVKTTNLPALYARTANTRNA